MDHYFMVILMVIYHVVSKQNPLFVDDVHTVTLEFPIRLLYKKI